MKLFGAITDGKDIVNKDYVDNAISGKMAFVATYDQTPYADVVAAIDANLPIIVDFPNNHNLECVTYSTYGVAGSDVLMYAIYKLNDQPALSVITVKSTNAWSIKHTSLQELLVSGTSIKTINNQSLLGSGNIDVGGEGEIVKLTHNVSTYLEVQSALQNGEQKTIILEYQGGTLIGKVASFIQGTNFIGLLCMKLGSYSWLDAGCELHYDYYPVNIDDTWGEPADGSFVNKAYVDDGIDTLIEEMHTKVNTTDQATDTTLGLIKLNPHQSVTVNESGQLEVGGRLGQFPSTTGIYAPNNRDPRNVLDYSFLMTDALGMDMSANRSLAVVSGYGLFCKSAAAGATEYRITNNYQNRIIAKLCENGYASRDEATSKVETIIPVVSVQIGGAAYTPDSSANSSANDIIITVAETLNPDTAITNIRLFGKMQSYVTMHLGNGVRSDAGGRSLVLGGGVSKTGSINDNCLVGNAIFSSGNGVAAFGRNHICRKNRGFFAGTGHDSTNARSEGASAVGEYSYMDSNTMFAVGNGTSHTARSNAFEVTSDGSMVLKSPNGTRYKIMVADDGTLTSTAV